MWHVFLRQRVWKGFSTLRFGNFNDFKAAFYSGRHKSPDGHYIRMKWPYFQSLKNIRNTARKDLKPSWLNAQHSEVSFGGLLCSFSTSRPCTKLPQSYEEFAFFIKNDRKQAVRVPPFSLKRAMRSPLVGTIFETYAKMVLINDDQGDIADIVLDVWLFDQKSNHPSIHRPLARSSFLRAPLTQRSFPKIRVALILALFLGNVSSALGSALKK